MNNQQFIIAISKGRILQETIPLLVSAGILSIESIKKNSRTLIFDTLIKDIKVIILRAKDILTYIKLGAADIGVIGKDILLEYGSNEVLETLDLKISCCKLMTAGLKGKNIFNQQPPIRIATKFVNIAKKYYTNKGIKVEIMKFNGAMELTPLMNIADEIVDIVNTGETLRENGMETRDLITEISSRLVIKAYIKKYKYTKIYNIIENLRSVVLKKKIIIK
ncbi:ATP phosphoribosyltransferase [Candidatus Johnevansia muelleri]|uniref:ATP phosphoribosyltransferase n=1 Tax=Candidatus Johnevansia muelleri TaxID=1495769 RepID=A0A078KEX9_9GAMM|nr:ATP phosphoribosyltransferase [Candidatus Evansia muelleri]